MIDFRRKWLFSACGEGERSLLLRKEWGNDGETRLLRKECRVDLRRKWLSSACIDGERSLLLWKEWGNAGETRLLRKECRADLRRKWLSSACSDDERSLPSEGVRKRFTVNMGLGEVLATWFFFADSYI